VSGVGRSPGGLVRPPWGTVVLWMLWMGRSPRSIVVVWGLALVRPVICICLVGELFTKREGATTGVFITGRYRLFIRGVTVNA
jgi:hypothetical protein